MTEPEKHMITDRVLDHCIFSNRPIHISFLNEPAQKTSFFVEEILEDCFVAEIAPENAHKIRHEDLRGQDLRVVTGHRNQAFIFTTRLVDTFKENGQKAKSRRTHFFFRKPPIGILQNLRENPRIGLDHYSPFLKAEVKISSQLGNFSFESRHLVDLSQNSLALFMDRDHGLVLPGDKVTSLNLYHQNEIVLETEGSVQRIDMKRVSDQMKNSYFIVIRLKQQPSTAPWRLWEEGQREAIRVSCSNTFADGDHSILRGYGFSGEILDLSTSGLSFSVDHPEAPFMTGLILNELFIHIPPDNPRLKASVKITRCTPFTGNGESGYNLSGNFLGMSIDLIKAINRLKDSLIDPHLAEAKREDFDQLLEFFFESGFIYSGKRKQLQKYAASVRKTNLILLQSGGPIMKKVVFKEDREIKGHISALRFFDHSWLVQHLTTHHSTGTATSSAILASITNFFLDPSANKRVNTNFVTCYYRPDNHYPEVLFGETQRVIGDPEICGISDLDFCVSGAAEKGPKTKMERSRVRCREALPADLVRLERLLVDQGQYFPIRIEGLTAEKMTTLKVSPEYERVGLYRKRRVLVANREGGGEVAYAVCNYTSPGCNLSELTNSFRFYYPPLGPDAEIELVNTLSRYVLASYKGTQMPSPVLLLDPNQFLPDTFKRIKRYRYWYFDASQIGLFKKTAEANIADIKEILRRFKTEKIDQKGPAHETIKR